MAMTLAQRRQLVRRLKEGSLLPKVAAAWGVTILHADAAMMQRAAVFALDGDAAAADRVLADYLAGKVLTEPVGGCAVVYAHYLIPTWILHVGRYRRKKVKSKLVDSCVVIRHAPDDPPVYFDFKITYVAVR